MKTLSELLLEHVYARTEFELLDELKLAMICYQKTDGISSICESSKYNFENCGAIVKNVVSYIEDMDWRTHIKEFDVKDVFFKKLSVSFVIYGNLEGSYIETKDDTVYIELNLYQSNIDKWDLKQRRRLIYTLIHELAHSYKDFLRKNEGKPSINSLMIGDYKREYKTAVAWYKTSLKDNDFKKQLARCKYFLDENEMEAYLATVEETIKNVITEVNPTYKDLKFDEILDMFKDEYIWQDYIHINVFVNELNNIDKSKLAREYNFLFRTKLSADDIIKDIKDKWNHFQKEFVETYIDGFAECFENLEYDRLICISSVNESIFDRI